MTMATATKQKMTTVNGARYSYKDTLAASLKVKWKNEDNNGGAKRQEFTADEKRLLNQIRGHAYLNIFGLVEEFILPFVMDHTRPQLDTDDYQTRAFLQFASEEAKHIHLFKRFSEEFKKGFQSDCVMIGPPSEIAQAVLAHHPLSVALVILHIEWMTQRHYLDSIADDQRLDTQFKSLLKHHWMEESQHAKLDTLMVESLAAGCNEQQIEAAINGYLEIGGFLDGGLKMQTQFDMEAFERVTGRTLTGDEREQFMSIQHQANRWTYLGSGMTHPNFLATVERLMPAARTRLEQEVAPMFC